MPVPNQNIRNRDRFFFGTTALLVLTLGNVAYPRIASAQAGRSFIAQSSSSLRAESAQSETLYLNNDRTYSYNLIAQTRGRIGNVTVPAGATIVGKYVPAEGGLRYIAEAVTYDNYSYSINAASSVIEDVKDPRDTSTGAIAEDAGIGAAGGLVLGEVFGDAGAAEIIGGAAAGAAAGNLSADRVVVIEPNESIALYE
ncbi:MAG: hypothetical protein AAFR63_16740 [Cyanobacteria bacterium J06631_6]